VAVTLASAGTSVLSKREGSSSVVSSCLRFIFGKLREDISLYMTISLGVTCGPASPARRKFFAGHEHYLIGICAPRDECASGLLGCAGLDRLQSSFTLIPNPDECFHIGSTSS
jgi:hypothetical protein